MLDFLFLFVAYLLQNRMKCFKDISSPSHKNKTIFKFCWYNDYFSTVVRHSMYSMIDKGQEITEIFHLSTVLLFLGLFYFFTILSLNKRSNSSLYIYIIRRRATMRLLFFVLQNPDQMKE